MIQQYPVKLVQTLGNEEYYREQHLNCFEYNDDGSHFALGDQSGLLHVFNYSNDEWVPVANFRAHAQNHDQQKNQPVECRVSIVKWLDSTLSSLKMLTCNYRFIKIWRLKDIDDLEIQPSGTFMPSVAPTGNSSYRENMLLDYRYVNEVTHLDLSKNNEYVITGTRSLTGYGIQKWSLEKINKSIVLWERKRDQNLIMEEEDELWSKLDVLCALRFHQDRDNCYAFSTKFGQIKYTDTRFSYSKPNVINMKYTPFKSATFKGSPYTKYLQVISDFKFMSDYNTLVSRDYFYIYAWDLRKPDVPVKTQLVFPQMIKLITELIKSNRTEDRFKLDVKGTKVVTNFYGDSFHLLDISNDENYRVIVEDGDVEVINKDYSLVGVPKDSKPHQLSFNQNKNEIGVTYNNRMDIYNY